MKFSIIRAIAASSAVFALLLYQSIGVSADTRSQVNVLPNTNTNIFDKSMLAELSEITETADRYGGNISVYYNDTETGYYFYYNPDETYKSASTVKASYCQYIIQSGADLDEKIKFTSAVKKSCSGLLSADKVGEFFTVRELIRITIIYSDNMSYRLLFNRFGYKGYNEYIKSLGLNAPQLTATYEYSKVTARDIAKSIKEALIIFFTLTLLYNSKWIIRIFTVLSYLVIGMIAELISYGSSFAAFAFIFNIMAINPFCRYFFHEPDIPKELMEYKKNE